MLDILSGLQDDTLFVIAWTLIPCGILLTFKGGKWFQIILFGVAGIAGACFAQSVTATVIDNHILALIGTLFGSIVVSLYRGTIFTLGAGCGLIAGELIWHFVNEMVPESFLKDSPKMYNAICVIGCALIGGYLAFVLMEVLLKGLTAFLGSFCVVSAVAFLVSDYLVEDQEINVLSMTEFFQADRNVTKLMNSSTCGNQCKASLVLWMILFFSGVSHQYGRGTAKKKKTQ